MRTFNANFTIEKNKRADGPTPVNLLTFGFATPVYLSDRDITPAGGPAHQGIIKSWGFVDTSITQTPGSGVLGSIAIADLQLTLINATSPPFSANFTAADPPENVTVTLYQLFGGRPYSEKEIIFKGLISGSIKHDLYTCTITIKGIFEKYDKQIGADIIIDVDRFPDADPDEYGKMQNIIYGSCPDVPCQAIVSGDVNSLAAAMTAAQTTVSLSDSSYFPASGIIGIGAEKISYTGNAANTLTGCTRGYGGTTATTHDSGAPCWEELSAFIYLVAGHPVKTINDIYVDGVRITSICTKYSGQAGDELAGWAGKAVFTVPTRLTRQQAIDLILTDGIAINDGIGVLDGIGVTDGISINDAISVVDGIGVSDGISVSDTIGVSTGSHSHTPAANNIITWRFQVASHTGTVTNDQACIDGDYTTYAASSSGGSITLTKTEAESYAGLPLKVKLGAKFNAYSGESITVDFAGASVSGGHDTSPQTYDSGWVTLGSSYNTWTELNAATCALSWTGNGGDVYEVWVSVEYDSATAASAATGVGKTGSATKSGSATKTGSATKGGTVSRSGAVSKTGAASKSGTVSRSGAVTLSGNSVADVQIGKLVTANVDGYQDTPSGTYTGTPNALIERPDHVKKHIWCVLLGAPSGDIDTASFAVAGAFYAGHAYKFALLINKPIQAGLLFMRLALQCRSRFLVTAYGTAKLIVRQLSQVSGHSIIKNEIKRDFVSILRSPSDEIINLLNVCYELDLTRDAGDAQAYYGVWNIQNPLSITRYGQREWKGAQSLFLFDAVRDAAMAQDVGTFLVDYHMKARKMPNISVFLDNMEIEPADIIDITHPLDNMVGFTVEVQKMLHHIGSVKEIDYLELVTIEQ